MIDILIFNILTNNKHLLWHLNQILSCNFYFNLKKRYNYTYV